MKPPNSKGEKFSKSLEIVRQVLDDSELKPETLDDGTGFMVAFDADTVFIGATAHLVDRGRFAFYIEVRHNVPEERRSAVAEFITRANYGLVIGNFEMDYGDGSVRFKTSIDFLGVKLSATIVRNTILAGMDAAAAYASGLVAVMQGTQTPIQAIEAVES